MSLPQKQDGLIERNRNIVISGCQYLFLIILTGAKPDQLHILRKIHRSPDSVLQVNRRKHDALSDDQLILHPVRPLILRIDK